MDPELKDLLIKTHSLAKQNHDMLRTMRWIQVWGFWGKILFWLAVILLPLYFLQPYLGVLPSAAELQNLVNQYKLH